MNIERMWKGKYLKDLTREELIEAVIYYMKRLDYLTTNERIEAYAVGKVKLIKRKI